MPDASRTFLVRHATSTSNDLGTYSGDVSEPLSRQGVQEAKRLAGAFTSVGLDKIVCSPFVRALQTAERIAKNKHLHPIVDRRFSELGLGPWDGLHNTEIERRFSDHWKVWRERPESLQLPGREELSMLRARVSPAFDELILQGESVAIFTHDAVIRVTVAHILGVPNSIYRSIPIANASISLVVSTRERHELHLLNSCSHLRGLE